MNKRPECTCPSWWDCKQRGCHEEARARYAGAMVERDRTFDARPEHDRDTAGRQMKVGR